MVVSSNTHDLYLRRTGRFARTWELRRGDQVTGTCRTGVFGARGDLPADLPMPLRVFLFYAVIMTDGGFILWF